MKTSNKLRFKDERDQAVANYHVNYFVDNFIPNSEIISRVEIDKNAIRIFNSDNGGFYTYDLPITPTTSKEMLMYLMTKNESKAGNSHIIEMKYFPASNTKGSGYKLTDTRFGYSKKINFDYSTDDTVETFKNAIKEEYHHLINGSGWNEKTGIYYIILNSDHNNSFIELKELLKKVL